MAKKADNVQFVTVEKDGMQLEIHPTTVDAHKAAGWKVIEAADPDPKPALDEENPVD
jgi:hypothetical protein